MKTASSAAPKVFDTFCFQKVLEDKKLADSLARDGKKFVAENFDWKSIVDKLDKVYDESKKYEKSKVNNNNS